jgi:predicted RNase H-like nuclease (RuvC/YqgF family)
MPAIYPSASEQAQLVAKHFPGGRSWKDLKDDDRASLIDQWRTARQESAQRSAAAQQASARTETFQRMIKAMDERVTRSLEEFASKLIERLERRGAIIDSKLNSRVDHLHEHVLSATNAANARPMQYVNNLERLIGEMQTQLRAAEKRIDELERR